MLDSRHRTGFAPALIAGFVLTMTLALGGCAAPQTQLADGAAQIPLGDWWPASADATPQAALRAARVQPAPANAALGDWWPSLAELRSPATLTTQQSARAEE